MSWPFSLEFFHLHYQGLTPMMKWADLPELPDNPVNSIPLRRNQMVQWLIQLPASCQRISLKLGTSDRMNHCHLELTILPPNLSPPHPPPAMATIDGKKIHNNQWIEFNFAYQLTPGTYWCQLQAPNANDQNTPFLWLTAVESGRLATYPQPIFDLQAYQLTPIIKLPTDADSQMEIITSLPLRRGKMVQWHIDWCSQNNSITHFLLKLGTCGRINHCQLILTLLTDTDQLDELSIITSIRLDGKQIIDNQWTPISLEKSFAPGKYRCRLHSPDADDLNTLFLWLAAV